MKHSAIYVGENTHILELNGLEDHLGNVQTDATVEVTAIVTAESGVAVAGVTVPISLVHASNGDYRGTLPHGGSFVEGLLYRATFKAVGSQGFRAEWVEALVARVRAA